MFKYPNKTDFLPKSMNILGLLLHIVSQRALIIFTASSNTGGELFYCTQVGDVN